MFLLNFAFTFFFKYFLKTFSNVSACYLRLFVEKNCKNNKKKEKEKAQSKTDGTYHIHTSPPITNFCWLSLLMSAKGSFVYICSQVIVKWSKYHKSLSAKIARYPAATTSANVLFLSFFCFFKFLFYGVLFETKHKTIANLRKNDTHRHTEIQTQKQIRNSLAFHTSIIVSFGNWLPKLSNTSTQYI